MSDIKLFRTNGKVEELPGTSVTVEKSLQLLFESNLEAFLGVQILESEYSIGPVHRGRIDTLGIDENHTPVIIEYKRATNENVINQGLYYLDWLLDHKAEFQLLVQRKFGQSEAEAIEWSSPRLICIAGDYTKFDEHAVQQINRQIELFRYKRYGEEFLMLERVNVPQSTKTTDVKINAPSNSGAPAGPSKTFEDFANQLEGSLLDVYIAFRDYMLALGDDIQIKRLKYYEAYKRIRNVATVVIQPQKTDFLVYVYKTDQMEWESSGVARVVDKLGHWGTGDLEITIHSIDDLGKAKTLLEKAYERS
ncbi:DUF5655 domain-containing protein [Ferroacidibacillus organovorans]|uniref:DUF91 domain-containing protein n=1 Tax=Ferroacidibacillus organovorans TaxID=1765683 RepID=A0A1V4EQU8_9BACL|nr:DUF5655 domain-containing protein [Ferroacidibacillus organovorans]OPG15220.1 DUF91 domain-containing protein [Ferroacidibacillus organovorans]